MAYLVLDEFGQPVVAVDPNDPDLKRILARVQGAVPYLAAGSQAAVPGAFTTQAPAQLPGNGVRRAVVPANKAVSRGTTPAAPATTTAYRVRFVPTGHWRGEGLTEKSERQPKTWPSLSSVKNAVSHAIRRKLGSADDFEIVPVTVTEP